MKRIILRFPILPTFPIWGAIAGILFVLAPMASGQGLSSSPDGQPGVRPSGSYSGGGIDSVSNYNGNVMLSLPLFSLPGRELSQGLNLTYNSKQWEPETVNGVVHGVYLGGWNFADSVGSLAVDIHKMWCNFGTDVAYFTSGYTAWVDGGGTRHFFNPLVIDKPPCSSNTPPDFNLTAADGSGMKLYVTPTARVLTFANGDVIDFTPTLSSLPAQRRTANGNFLSGGMADNPQPDTLGRTIGYCTSIAATCGGLSNTGTSTFIKRYQITDANGNDAVYVLHYTLHTVTDPLYNGSGSAATSIELLDSIDLPDNSHYSFDYNHVQGFLTNATLPSGATIEYLYHGCTSTSSCSDTNAADDYVKERRISPDGSSPATWTYSRDTSDPARTVTMTNPDGSKVEHTFNASGLETLTRWLEPDTTEVQRVTTTWKTSGSDVLPYPETINTIVGTVQRQTAFEYDSGNRVTQKDDSDWYSASTTNVAKLARTITGYDTLNSITVLKSVQVQGWISGGYVTQSKTEYFYDQGSVTSTSSSVPNKGTPFVDRGNLTKIRRYSDATHWVDETFEYDDLGNMIKHYDTLQNLTTIIYDDNYSNTSHNGLTYAFPTSVTNAKNQTAQVTYHFESGVVTASTDIRGNATTSTYYSPFNRVEQISAPGGQVSHYVYNDSTHSVLEEVTVATGKIRSSKVIADTLGRPVEAIQYDPDGDVHVTTAYDNNGRASQTSSPYRTGEMPVYTVTTFDALSRPLSVTHPDSTAVHFYYSSNTVTTTDEANVARGQVFNGLGQLVQVHEPNPTLTTPLVTAYVYDVTGPLRHVQQSSQGRTFTTNWLGQVTQEIHPETGTTDFEYDNGGNLIHRTDARSIRTDYTYDELSRLLTTSYSDGTPPVTLTYDAGTGNAGLLTQVTVGNSAIPLSTYGYSYDAAGAVTAETRTFKNISGTFDSSYSYDLGGRLLTATYPSGRTISQSYISSSGQAGDRIDSMTESKTSATLVNGIALNAAGQVTSRTLGSGTIVTQSYNNRNQLTGIAAAQSSTNLLSMSYGYGSTDNVGRIRTRTDNIQPEHTASYGYDNLYRLTDVSGASGSWTMHWDLDPYGNRTGQTVTGMATSTNGSSVANQTIGISYSTNRVNGLTYDAAGNIVNDGQNSYAYDGEGRLQSVNGGAVRYEYDWQGRRLKTTLTSGTNISATYSIFGLTGLQSEFTRVSSGAIGSTSSDLLQYRVPEQTGTGVLLVSASGTVTDNSRVFPFGEPWRVQAVSVDAEQFTSYQHDPNTGLDYAMARDYASRNGRFMTADPGHVGASLGDPQSWNAYAYTENDPINQTDPTGLRVAFDTPDGPGDAADVDFAWLARQPGWYIPASWVEDHARGWMLEYGIVRGNYYHYSIDALVGPVESPGGGGGAGGGGDGGGDGGSGGSGGPGTPTVTSTSGRVCAVANSGVGFLGYLEGFISAAVSTAQWFEGSGPQNIGYGTNSIESRMMASSAGVRQAVGDFLTKDIRFNEYKFGLGGVYAAGINPRQQFVGSFEYEVSPTRGGLSVTMSNGTSFGSASYHLGRSWDRSQHMRTPMGTAYQNYQVFVPCSN